MSITYCTVLYKVSVKWVKTDCSACYQCQGFNKISSDIFGMMLDKRLQKGYRQL